MDARQLAAYARFVKSTPADGAARDIPPIKPDQPYEAAHQRLTSACAEADRLTAISDQHQARLRDARRSRARFENESEQGLALADPRRLATAKHAALLAYREQVRQTSDRSTMLAGTATYLRELTKLNRAAKRVAGQGEDLAVRQREYDEKVNQLQMAAEAARVAAEGAREACLEARRTLVQHDESMAAVEVEYDSGINQSPTWEVQLTPIEALLEGDRDVFGALVNRLAEEIGLDSSRLQLLLLELREALFEGARAAAVLNFPPTNQFWAQLPLADARAVAGALEILYRPFDGRDGWAGGRVAEPREMAIAVSMAGQDPRLLRVRPAGPDLETLWQGVTVDPVEYVRQRSADLALDTFEPLTGTRAGGLAELWNNWGRMRRLMLDPELISPG